LPIERIDEEANFAATSNINETRFHKDRGDRTQRKKTLGEIHFCLTVFAQTWRKSNLLETHVEGVQTVRLADFGRACSKCFLVHSTLSLGRAFIVVISLALSFCRTTKNNLRGQIGTNTT